MGINWNLIMSSESKLLCQNRFGRPNPLSLIKAHCVHLLSEGEEGLFFDKAKGEDIVEQIVKIFFQHLFECQQLDSAHDKRQTRGK